MSRSDQDAMSPAELFDLRWESLADVLGTAVTASEPVIADLGSTLRRGGVEQAMPIDGYEVGRRIRAALGSRGLLVAVTAYGQEQDRRRSSEAGFDAHLVKPVSHEDLTRLLGRGGPSDA